MLQVADAMLETIRAAITQLQAAAAREAGEGRPVQDDEPRAEGDCEEDTR